MTTYQKLKENNRLLAEELFIVCLQPESQNAQEIKQRIRLQYDTEKALWQGDSNADHLKGFKGYLNHLK